MSLRAVFDFLRCRTGNAADLPAAAAASPIVVGGFYRSGTSLMRRLLDSHSRIHCAPEIKFFRDFNGEYADDVYAHLRYFSSCRSLPLSRQELLRVSGRAYLELRQLAAHKQSKPRWADKDPENARYLTDWQTLLPQGFQYIHMARDPDDTLASLREARFNRSLPEDLPGMAECLRQNCMAARQFFEQHPERCRLLRYEDLVRNPASELQQLFAWLGETFEARVLEDFHHNERGTGLEDPKASASRVIHDNSIGRGKRDLSTAERQQVRTILGENLAWLGYADTNTGMEQA